MSKEEPPVLPDTAEFHRQLIERARRGDADAGKEILKLIVHRIDLKDYESPLFTYLAECLWDYAYSDMKLERALNVEVEDENKGGAPVRYNQDELAAAYVLLRYYVGYKPQNIHSWLYHHTGASEDTIRRVRKTYRLTDPRSTMRNMTRDWLLHLSGKYRHKVAEVMPQK